MFWWDTVRGFDSVSVGVSVFSVMTATLATGLTGVVVVFLVLGAVLELDVRDVSRFRRTVELDSKSRFCSIVTYRQSQRIPLLVTQFVCFNSFFQQDILVEPCSWPLFNKNSIFQDLSGICKLR